MKKKKTCDNKKQNSYDINTNQTLLKKKKNQTPILLKKILWEKTLWKKKTKKTTL